MAKAEEKAPKEPHEMTREEFERSQQADTYGDWYFTPDGKFVQMRGSGGMGSERVGGYNVSGTMVGWFNRSDLRLAKKETRKAPANDAADQWLVEVSAKVAKLKKKNEGLLLNKGLTDRLRSSLASGKMTPEQFDKAKSKGSILSDSDYAKAVNVEKQLEDARNTPLAIPENKQHRAVVESALAAGKPVPPEVLADYPDLVPKQQAIPMTPQTDLHRSVYHGQCGRCGAPLRAVLEHQGEMLLISPPHILAIHQCGQPPAESWLVYQGEQQDDGK